jgi:hypothetical protein
MAASPFAPMKIRNSTSAVLKQKGRYLLTLAALLCLFSLAWAQSANQQKSLRRVTGLLVGQATEGSRVTVIADSMLDDYEAFRRGDRFYIRIPLTEFMGMQPSFHGDGFDDVQVQKVGDSVVISFKLQPGASARVDGGSNRLEVIFFSPSRMAGINNANANAIRSRVTRNSGRGGTFANGSTPRRGSDVAGPMPPDSPTVYSPRKVEDSTSADNAMAGAPSSVRTPNRRESTPTVAPATDSAVPSGSPNQTATPYASSQYSSSYPPAGPASTPIVQTSTPSVAATDWRNRIKSARQWVAVNRMAALIGGVALLALLGLMVFVVYRRRTARQVRLNTPRTQPKHSPDVQLEDMLASRASDVSARVAPGPYVDEDAYEHWGDSIIGSETMEDPQGDPFYKSATLDDFSGTKDEPWEFVATPDSPVYQGRVHEEREVFEL